MCVCATATPAPPRVGGDKRNKRRAGPLGMGCLYHLRWWKALRYQLAHKWARCFLAKDGFVQCAPSLPLSPITV